MLYVDESDGLGGIAAARNSPGRCDTRTPTHGRDRPVLGKSGTVMTEEPSPADGSQQEIGQLGAMLRARRRARHLSLRDLAAEIGVSFNTLSRVERGHVPDIKNFQRIVEWLEMPTEAFLDPAAETLSTPEVILRHLRSDPRLTGRAVDEIAELLESTYHRLVNEQPRVAIHLRSAKTFTPAAGALLSEILTDIRSSLLSTGESG